MSAAVRLLGLWVRIPPGPWMFVSFEWCVLSCIGFCDELITLPEEFYRLWCVVECDLETSRNIRFVFLNVSCNFCSLFVLINKSVSTYHLLHCRYFSLFRCPTLACVTFFLGCFYRKVLVLNLNITLGRET